MVLNLTPFKILSFSFVSSKLIGLYLGTVFFLLICLGIIEILGLMAYSFHQSWKIWGHYFFAFFLSCSLSRPAVTHIQATWNHFTALILCYFQYLFLFVFHCRQFLLLCFQVYWFSFLLKLPIFLLVPFRVCVCLKSQTLFCVLKLNLNFLISSASLINILMLYSTFLNLQNISIWF